MNVLLVANVGGGTGGFYHVGDEAMFYETYRSYQTYAPQWRIGALSSAFSHTHLNITEHLHLPWPESNARLARHYFFKLVIKLLIWRIFSISLFTTEQRAFFDIINAYDRIHFTGGGNITSIFGGWLYYSFFIMVIAAALGKDIFLTSQTIGPFYGVDRLISICCLNLATTLYIREPVTSTRPLLSSGVFIPPVYSMVDAATSLASTSSFSVSKKPQVYTIGLSLHRWPGYELAMKQWVGSFIQACQTRGAIRVVLIPHVITKNLRGGDMAFMDEVTNKFSRQVEIVRPTFSQLMDSSIEPASTIKALTTQVDLLISSRYHGLVFALSTHTPAIGFVMDTYYNRKNFALTKLHRKISGETGPIFITLDKTTHENH